MLVFQSLLETEMDLQSKARTMEQIKDQLKLEEIQGHKVLEGMSYFVPSRQMLSQLLSYSKVKLL